LEELFSSMLQEGTLAVENANTEVRYLVFDVESVADGSLVSKLRYPAEELSPQDAVARYRQELLEKYDTDFIPYTYQVPAAIAIAKVSADFRLLDIVSLDEPQHRPHIMTRAFWRGWERYNFPTWVSFNGRTFDMPLMELAAFRYGVSLATWFSQRGSDSPRYRYNSESHLDLHDVLTNFGAVRFHGGLNLAANILGKPGKMDIQGFMVQDLVDQRLVKEVSDYCRCDVLDTYFVFLRVMVLMGRLTLEEEQQRVADTKRWIELQAEQMPAYARYLEHWGDWWNPWLSQAAAASATATV
jgi:predicted PolB exonuclease-like 3'-5' exonuclease